MNLTQIALHEDIPFEMKIPNDVTAQTLQDSEEGQNLHQVDSVDDLFKELDC
jgi:DNA-damage-inducible protein J